MCGTGEWVSELDQGEISEWRPGSLLVRQGVLSRRARPVAARRRSSTPQLDTTAFTVTDPAPLGRTLSNPRVTGGYTAPFWPVADHVDRIC